MGILRDLETIFFFFGFRKCTRNESINFKKLSDDEFLVVRVFGGKIADLLLEKYDFEKTPCNSKPISDKVIKLGFTENDADLLRKFIS